MNRRRQTEHAYELHDLAEYVKLAPRQFKASNRKPRTDVGRNVFLFDEVRFWAYDHIHACRSMSFESWEQSVIAAAEHINSVSYKHLPWLASQSPLTSSECNHIGKSAAKWVWTSYGKRMLTAAFSRSQSLLGERGAVAAAEVKRARREGQIVEAIGLLTTQGHVPTMCKVAELIGCSKGNLSMHYKQFFPGTTQ